MKKFARVCTVLAVVLGASVTADAQNYSRGRNNNRQSGIIDFIKGKHQEKNPGYKTVYEIAITPSFKGLRAPGLYSRYESTYRVKVPGRPDTVVQGTTNAPKYHTVFTDMKRPLTLKGVDPNAKLTFRASSRLAADLLQDVQLRSAEGQVLDLANYPPDGKRRHIELDSSDFIMRINFRITEKQVPVR